MSLSSNNYKNPFTGLSSQEVRDLWEGVDFSVPVREGESVEVDRLVEGVDFSNPVRAGETSSSISSDDDDDFSNTTEQFSKLCSYYSA